MNISNLSIPKGGKILKSPNPAETIFRLDNRDYYTGIFLIFLFIVFSIIVFFNGILLYIFGLPMVLSAIYAVIHLSEYILITVTSDDSIVIKTLFKKHFFGMDQIDDIFVEIVAHRYGGLAPNRSATKQYLFIKCGPKDFRLLTNADYENLKFIESIVFEIKGWKWEEE